MTSPLPSPLREKLNLSFQGEMSATEKIPQTQKSLPKLKNTKNVLLLKTAFIFLISLVGAVAGLSLTRINQDLRQQAATVIYGPKIPLAPTGASCTIHNDCASGLQCQNQTCQQISQTGFCSTLTCSATYLKYPISGSPTLCQCRPEVTENALTINPYSFAYSATTANTNTFVVTPGELGYDPDTVIVSENVIFNKMAEGYPNNQVWTRGYEWHDKETRDEYHSTIIGYTNQNSANSAFQNGPKTTKGKTRLDGSDLSLPNVNADSLYLFQSSDPDHTINLSFFVGNYMVVLKTKGITDIEFAKEKLEKMARALINDLDK